jgi:hypothetical protein
MAGQKFYFVTITADLGEHSNLVFVVAVNGTEDAPSCAQPPFTVAVELPSRPCRAWTSNFSDDGVCAVEPDFQLARCSASGVKSLVLVWGAVTALVVVLFSALG